MAMACWVQVGVDSACRSITASEVGCCCQPCTVQPERVYPGLGMGFHGR